MRRWDNWFYPPPKPKEVDREAEKRRGKAKRVRKETTQRRKAERECHARPNDHAQRFSFIAELHPNNNGVRQHGFSNGCRAKRHIGVADDMTTAAPDDDPAEYIIDFYDLSCGRVLR